MSDKHNYYVDLFRFFLILWIVLFHYTFRYNEMFPLQTIDFGIKFDNGGRLGVSLFFIVSGFYMMKSLLCEKSGSVIYFKYLFKRYYRLWLPYSISCVFIYTWLLLFPLPNRSISFSSFLLNIPLIYHPGIDSVDNAHWFIGDLFLLQLLIGLVLLIRQNKYRKLIIYAFFIISLLITLCGIHFFSGLMKEIFEVSFGMLLFLLHKERKPVLIMMCLGGLLYIYTISAVYLIWVVFFIILEFKTIKVASSGLVKNMFAYLGTMSFYWYLVHQNIGYSIIYHFFPSGASGFIWLIIPMLSTLLIATVVSLICQIIDKPLQEKVRILIN